MPRKAIPVPESTISEILVHVSSNPGCKSKSIAEGVSGDVRIVKKAIKMLRDDGRIKMEGSRKNARYFRGNAEATPIAQRSAAAKKATSKVEEKIPDFETAEDFVEYALTNLARKGKDYFFGALAHAIHDLGKSKFSYNDIADLIQVRARSGNKITWRHVYKDGRRIAYTVTEEVDPNGDGCRNPKEEKTK